MKRIVLLFLLIIFLMQLISSLGIGISPAYINLEAKIGEKICNEVTVYSDRSINITIESRWTDNDSRNLRNYNLRKENLKIELISPEKIFVSSRENIEICFIGGREGNFYGAILFDSENGYASVGSWINLKITKRESSVLTGNLIKNILPNNFLALGIATLFFEGIVLFYLVKKLNKKEKITKNKLYQLS